MKSQSLLDRPREAPCRCKLVTKERARFPLVNRIAILPAARPQIRLFLFHQRSTPKPSLGEAHPHVPVLRIPSSSGHGFAFGGEPLEVLDAHRDSPLQCPLADKRPTAPPVPAAFFFLVHVLVISPVGSCPRTLTKAPAACATAGAMEEMDHMGAFYWVRHTRCVARRARPAAAQAHA